LTAAIAAALVLATMRGVLRAGVGAVSADRVLGQIDFIKTAVNFVDPIGMDAPAGVAIDHSAGHVLVADTQNNRVMGWKSIPAFASGGAADLVIGQPDFNSSGCNQNAPAPGATSLCQPIGVAVDVSHNVYVGDTQNNRVLVFEDPFAALSSTNQTNDFAAFAVFGQAGSFVTNAVNENGLSANSLSSPQGVAVDANGNLFVADVSNNRALVFFRADSDDQGERAAGEFRRRDGGRGDWTAQPGQRSLQPGRRRDSHDAVHGAVFRGWDCGRWRRQSLRRRHAERSGAGIQRPVRLQADQ
jgi:DNA-binding beta-propeller fold protein YncE